MDGVDGYKVILCEIEKLHLLTLFFGLFFVSYFLKSIKKFKFYPKVLTFLWITDQTLKKKGVLCFG